MRDRKDRGPGVPEAVPQGVQRILAEIPAESLDRFWVFPPMISGRRESGLITVSVFKEGSEDERRLLVILPYSAERTGKGLTLDSSVEEQGEAPVDRFPRMMEGVVRRTEHDLGEPREVEILGDPEQLDAFFAEFDVALLDENLPPRGPKEEEVPDALEGSPESTQEPAPTGDPLGAVDDGSAEAPSRAATVPDPVTPGGTA